MVESKQPIRTYGQWWESPEEQVTVPLAAVEKVGLAVLQAGGASAEDAAFLLDIGLGKAMQGDYVRGLGRLSGWLRASQRGDLDMRPQMRILQEKDAVALVDGGPKALDALVCRFAMDLAVEKARKYGVGWVSAQASGGILAPYLKRAAAGDMVAMIFTQAAFPTVAPTGGVAPILGNAPVGYAIPAGRHDPVIVDMAISQSSASPVAEAGRRGDQVPSDFILDREGQPTTDAVEFIDPEYEGPNFVPRGSLLPLGGSRSGHKGYALVFVVGLLTHLLSDTSPPWELGLDSESRGRTGTLFMALDPSSFLPIEEFKKRVDQFIDTVQSSPRKEGVDEILYPGQRSQELQRAGRATGRVTMPASHYQMLVDLAREVGLEGAL